MLAAFHSSVLHSFIDSLLNMKQARHTAQCCSFCKNGVCNLIFCRVEMTLKLVLTPSRRELHDFWKSARCHKELIISLFLFFPCMWESFHGIWKRSTMARLSKWVWGAVAECIFTSLLLVKSHLSELFSVADLVLYYGILPDFTYRLTVLTPLLLLLTCHTVDAFCKRLFKGLLASEVLLFLLWAATLLMHTSSSFKAVSL